jgi:excinuclease ABC subunit C
MATAASELRFDFEHAARLRDQIAQPAPDLRAAVRVSGGEGDADVIALAREGGSRWRWRSFSCAGARTWATREHFPETCRRRLTPGRSWRRCWPSTMPNANRLGARPALASEPEERVGAGGLPGTERRGGRKVQLAWSHARGSCASGCDMARAQCRTGAENPHLASQAGPDRRAWTRSPRRTEPARDSPEAHGVLSTSRIPSGERTVASCVVFGPDGPDQVGLPALQYRRDRAG